MDRLETNVRNRTWMLDRIRAEFVGPDPPPHSVAEVISYSKVVEFTSWDHFRRPKIQPDGEEILWQDPPLRRYGAGVLFPAGVVTDDPLDAGDEEDSPDAPAPDDPDEAARLASQLDKMRDIAGGSSEDLTGGLEEDVALANSYRPASLAVSFLGDLDREEQGLEIRVSFATYRKATALIHPDDGDSGKRKEPAERTIWFRVSPEATGESSPTIFLSSADILAASHPVTRNVPGDAASNLKLIVLARPHGAGDTRLFTVCLKNDSRTASRSLDESSYFQCELEVRGASGRPWILPYPQAPVDSLDEEERTTRLLYRDRRIYAIGHGCSAEWDTPCDLSGDIPCATAVRSEVLPVHETLPITPDIRDSSGNSLRVDMRPLAGLRPDDDWTEEILHLADEYDLWIEGLGTSIREGENREEGIPPGLRETATALVSRCKECARRIREGVRYLEENPLALKAFNLTNETMLISQLRASRTVRTPRMDPETYRMEFDAPAPAPDLLGDDASRGYWRPFQIAFLLMSIPGICEPDHPDREIVDLIWFPTGGGKTEAYLGLTAFTILYNRLEGRSGAGADVLMRYTLRLLTAQQFERASLLFCAMEDVRERHRKSLGDRPFRLGMWVGGSATPNTRQQAVTALRRLRENPGNMNPFIVLKCPWCHARFGPMEDEDSRRGSRRRGADSRRVFGYEEMPISESSSRNTVVFRCYDPGCAYYSRPLPILVVDEDIYEMPPDLVIATVDKLALLTWKPETGSLFGIGAGGTRTGPPPTLIIQDELHLISGPLGSMVGAFETVIEELCTLRETDDDSLRRCLPARPKIIASTATISRAREQIFSLYAREQTQLFPPSGLEATDSFFAVEDHDRHGRMYVGLLAPAHGSQQTTQARLFATLLQGAMLLPTAAEDPASRDPWWTLLAFFNSLRELGSVATLLLADTRDYLRVILDRHGHRYSENRRTLYEILELTSRIPGDKIPESIKRLEVPYGSDGERGKRGKHPVDVCLASSIIEVGVDIDRLAIMTIVGQPKTVSQYIQVTGRVGRRSDTPGLVIVSFSQAKPRDRSHYESFRGFHQALHAGVEPTSVTPFSPPATDRLLHAILVALVRQVLGGRARNSPDPFPLEPGSPAERLVRSVLTQRVEKVDPGECDYLLHVLGRRLEEWRSWAPASYGGFGTIPEDPPLMHPAGSHVPESWEGRSWPTPSSLRNVDATCEAEITFHYNQVTETGGVS